MNEVRFTLESARFVLSLTFNQRTQDRVQELLTRNEEGQIPAAEREELGQLVKANTYLATLQSKARLILKKAWHS
jgi:hypothetical protein